MTVSFCYLKRSSDIIINQGTILWTMSSPVIISPSFFVWVFGSKYARHDAFSLYLHLHCGFRSYLVTILRANVFHFLRRVFSKAFWVNFTVGFFWRNQNSIGRRSSSNFPPDAKKTQRKTKSFASLTCNYSSSILRRNAIRTFERAGRKSNITWPKKCEGKKESMLLASWR